MFFLPRLKLINFRRPLRARCFAPRSGSQVSNSLCVLEREPWHRQSTLGSKRRLHAGRESAEGATGFATQGFASPAGTRRTTAAHVKVCSVSLGRGAWMTKRLGRLTKLPTAVGTSPRLLATLLLMALPLGTGIGRANAFEAMNPLCATLPITANLPGTALTVRPQEQDQQLSLREDTESVSGLTVNGFRAIAVDGRPVVVEPTTDPAWTVVCFVGNDCPLVKLYTPRLNELNNRYRDRSVQFIAVNSNTQDTLPSIRSFQREHGLAFPILHDEDQSLLSDFDARRTPEVFVLDQELRVRYRGRIDDQYQPGVARPKPNKSELVAALDGLLAGGVVPTAKTDAVGCLIGRVESQPTGTELGEPVISDPSVPTFTKDVAAIVYKRCGECHRPNDIAPFELIEFEDVRGWGEMIVEVIDDGLMPPWHANPQHGSFSNARVMPESEKEVIRQWVANGAPRGEGAVTAQVPPPSAGWVMSREPDLLVPMSSQPFLVPDQGVVDYQYFVVDPGLREDRWITAAQIVPGNRRVVHHSIVFVKSPDSAGGSGQGWLAAYVPGQKPLPYPEGHARLLPAGSKLIFQQHYTPNGIAQDDVTKIGLFFADPETITHEVTTMIALNTDFEIPPHASSYSVSGRLRRHPHQGYLLGLSPHMHYRGTAFRLTAVPRASESALGTAAPQVTFTEKQESPEIDSLAVTSETMSPPEILLDVPNYDFNWQHVYAFEEPLPLSELSDIRFEAVFDNSEHNPSNPDPTQLVTWGDQSWEEMAIVYFDVAFPRTMTNESSEREDTVARAPQTDSRPSPHTNREETGANGELENSIEREVDAFFARHNHATETKIPVMALPEVLRRFANLDSDDDGQLSRDEVRAEFSRRMRGRD